MLDEEPTAAEDEALEAGRLELEPRATKAVLDGALAEDEGTLTEVGSPAGEDTSELEETAEGDEALAAGALVELDTLVGAPL